MMPTKTVFLDTSGWIALLNTRDNIHQQASTIWKRLAEVGSRIVVTDWVVAETGNGLAGTPLRPGFVEAVRHVLSKPQYRLVEVDGTLLDRAVDLYAARPDKEWGLVDCASFIIMYDLDINDALTADHHFAQAGFRALLGRPRR